MIQVTQRAATELQNVLQGNHAPPEQAVRLVPDGAGGLGMAIDAPRETDVVIRCDEASVLIVDRDTAGYLTDAVVDFVAAEDNPQAPPGFVVRPRQGGE